MISVTKFTNTIVAVSKTKTNFMKKLIVVRHGKSSWKNPDLADHDRPLKKRGYNDAQLVIKAFKTYFQQPVKMLSSSAKRALTTAEMFKEGLEVSDDYFKVNADLYTFDVSELLEVIKSQSDEENYQNNEIYVFGYRIRKENI